MNLFTAVLYLHIATVAVSVGLFVLRYWWMYHQSPLLNQRWVRRFLKTKGPRDTPIFIG